MADTAKSNEIIVKRITLTGFVLNIVLEEMKHGFNGRKNGRKY